MNIKKYKRSDYEYLAKYPTRWGDMDGLRHLNHAIYLTFMETARIDYYGAMGLHVSRWNSDDSSILASMKVDYFTQVHHPAILEIGQRVTRVGNTSFDILTGIFVENSEEPVCQTLFTMVTFNYSINKPIKVPEEIKNCLKPLK